MPVAQGGPPPIRQVLLIGLGAVVGLLSVLFLVTQMDRLLGGVSDIDFDIGDGTYRPGGAEDLADAIDTEGPFLLPDLAGGDRDVFLQHVGPDPQEGWLAIGVRPQTAGRDCSVEWAAEDRTFVDSCDGTTYPEDGRGLPQYGVSIDDDGELIVDLNVVIPSASDD